MEIVYYVQARFLFVKQGALGSLITWDFLLLAGGWSSLIVITSSDKYLLS